MDQEYYGPPEGYATESDLDELRERLDALEEGNSLTSGEAAYLSEIAYLSGVALAMVLSWSRNASILWCMAHGLVSWGYVIYFAFTR